MRLFIAINLDDKTKSALLALRDELRSRSEYGSFTQPENLHLTLAFLGECSAEQAAAAEAAMDMVNFGRFDLVIDRVGRFGGNRGTTNRVGQFGGNRGTTNRDGRFGSKHGNSTPEKPQGFAGRGAATERASFSPTGGNERAQSAATTWWAGLRESKTLLELQRDLTGKLSGAGFVLESRRFSPHITIGRRVETGAAPWSIEPFGETVGKIDLMLSERIDGRLTYTEIYTKRSSL